MFQNNGPPSYQPRGFSPEPGPQRTSVSRPSGKSIYMQRKEYVESINRQPDNFQFRVEHLFTCELDGKEVCSLDDCIARLKRLDSRGRVWGQEMILEVQSSYLQLSDIETKEVLESFHLGTIHQTGTVLDSCAFNSILTVTVRNHPHRPPLVFLFQCEETGAQEVREDLDRAIQQRGQDPQRPPEMPPEVPPQDIRNNLNNIIGQRFPGSFRNPGITVAQPVPTPPEHRPPQWNAYPEYDDGLVTPPMYTPRDEPPLPEPFGPPETRRYTDMDRSMEILNHVLDDVEHFMQRVAAAMPQDNGRKDKKRKKKKRKDQSAMTQAGDLPGEQEFIDCLAKIKYGFNLLGKLRDHFTNPGAPDFVHSLFSSLGFLVGMCPPDVPPSVLVPLLTEPALQLLSQLVSPQEDQLWVSLGDAWNIPRSKWQGGPQLPPYIPVFYDGWQPPPPVQSNSAPPGRALSRNNSQRLPPPWHEPEQHLQDGRAWNAPPTPPSMEPPLYMRVIYDFTSRNHQELSVMKGEVVQVVKKSKQWWRVRNTREEEGHVPQNVLEPMDGEGPREMGPPPSLHPRAPPQEVRAWLQYKGFSKTTVQSLGMLNGDLLLRMRRDEIKNVCPEEGGRVFFHLQAVKSSLALASEDDYDPYHQQNRH